MTSNTRQCSCSKHTYRNKSFIQHFINKCPIFLLIFGIVYIYGLLQQLLNTDLLHTIIHECQSSSLNNSWIYYQSSSLNNSWIDYRSSSHNNSWIDYQSSSLNNSWIYYRSSSHNNSWIDYRYSSTITPEYQSSSLNYSWIDYRSSSLNNSWMPIFFTPEWQDNII